MFDPFDATTFPERPGPRDRDRRDDRGATPELRSAPPCPERSHHRRVTSPRTRPSAGKPDHVAASSTYPTASSRILIEWWAPCPSTRRPPSIPLACRLIASVVCVYGSSEMMPPSAGV